MIAKKILLVLSLCAMIHAQSDTTEKYIAGTNRAEAMYELLATEAKQLTSDRKEQLLICADKAIVQRKRETGLLHMWRDYKTLAYAALFAVPTAKVFYNFGSELKKTLEREAAGMPSPAGFSMVFAGAMLGVSMYTIFPFSVVYCSKILGRTYAKERLADAQLIKKTIERLPVV